MSGNICYVSAHFRYLLTTFVLIRNILIAFTTSCVSIFDISNDILYTSFTSTNADFRFIQILHVPLYFIGQKFSHEQIQHGLLFTKRIAWFVSSATSTLYFPTVWNLVSVFKKISPFYFFYGAFWSKIGDLNSHPQFGKLMCWPLTLILHIKMGSQALPVPYLTWFFDEMVSPQTLRLFLRRLLRKSHENERDYLIFTSIIWRKKRPICP